MRIKANWHWIALACFFLELAFQTFWRGELGQHLSASIHFSSGLVLGLLLLWQSLSSKQKVLPTSPSTRSRSGFYLLGLLGTALIALILQPIFKNNPLDFLDTSKSDIIPQIGIMVQRFLAGEFPYETIKDWGWDMSPTYMPLQWLPYSFAELLDFDYRWIAFGALAFVLFFYIHHIVQTPFTKVKKGLLVILPYLSWYLIIKEDPNVFAVTVENLIAAYYLLLGLALVKDSRGLLLSSLLLCLLSRYAVVIWIPFLLLILFFEKRKYAIQLGLGLFVGVLVIYVLPFLSKDPNIFLKGYAYHHQAALGEWAPFWQTAGEAPYHLFKGLGFAGFFYEYFDGTLETRLQLLQYCHLGLLFLTLTALGSIYYRFKAQLSLKIFLLASLKIYLCVFYCFIQIPYAYLFSVPLFFSILILMEIWKERESKSVSYVQ